MTELFLRPEVFTLGQLYVAMSREGLPAKLKVAAMNDYGKNIIFRGLY